MRRANHGPFVCTTALFSARFRMVRNENYAVRRSARTPPETPGQTQRFREHRWPQSPTAGNAGFTADVTHSCRNFKCSTSTSAARAPAILVPKLHLPPSRSQVALGTSPMFVNMICLYNTPYEARTNTRFPPKPKPLLSSTACRPSAACVTDFTRTRRWWPSDRIVRDKNSGPIVRNERPRRD